MVGTSLATSYAVISESQKQARMGWATVQMARHYTDRVGEEDMKAAGHIGVVLGGTEKGQPRSSRRSALRFPKSASS
jgi:hypothetical protein